MVASSKKISQATKSIITELVDTVKSYSQKKMKKESQKRNRDFFICNNEVNFTFGEEIPEKAERGCGSFHVDPVEEAEFTDKIADLVIRLSVQKQKD